MTTFGIDVSQHRLDDQDRSIIDLVLKKDWLCKRALILGSGKGRNAVMLALLGFEVICVDIEDHAEYFKEINKSLQLRRPIIFIQKDLGQLTRDEVKGEFTIVISQRALHYMPYNSARHALELAHARMKKSAHLFINITTNDSAFGVGYEMTPDITKRYGLPSAEAKEQLNLTTPLCLYTKKEAQALMKTIGFRKKTFTKNSFGNIKAHYIK